MTDILRDVVVTGVDAQGVRATFYTKSVHNKARTAEEGRPVYEPKIYVKIQSDADNKTGWDLPLKEPEQYPEAQNDPRNRWADVWKQFEAGSSGEIQGTPLADWAMIPAHRVRELNALGIKSLEQLAHLPDDKAGKIGPDGITLRDGAKKFLEPADLQTLTLQRENADLKQQMANLEAKFTQLQNQRFGDEDEAPPPAKRGPGRPRRNA